MTGPAESVAEGAAGTTGDAPRDFDLLVVGTRGPGGIGQYIDEQRRHLAGELRVRTHQIGGFDTDGPVAFLRSVLAILLNALRFPGRTPPDVVHVHASHRFSFYRAGFYVLWARYVWRVPVLLHIHGSSFDEFVRQAPLPVRWYQSLVFDAATEIVVLSGFWKEVVGERARPDTVTVLPNAVEADDFEPASESEVPHVVFVSSMIDRKGVPELLAAVERLGETDRQFRVSLAGMGPLADRAERLADEHANVEFLGYVSEAEKQRLLSTGSIFVLPTHAEGLPIAMLEGMAGGNAVVSTTVGAIPEVIGEENGLLVDPGDADALADALAALIDDPERVEAMGRTNRRLVEERYAWSSIVDQLLERYERYAEA